MILLVSPLPEARDHAGREVGQLAAVGIFDRGQDNVRLVSGNPEQVPHQGPSGSLRAGRVRADQRNAPLDRRQAISPAFGDQVGVPARLVLAIGVRVCGASRITQLVVPLMVQ